MIDRVTFIIGIYYWHLLCMGRKIDFFERVGSILDG